MQRGTAEVTLNPWWSTTGGRVEQSTGTAVSRMDSNPKGATSNPAQQPASFSAKQWLADALQVDPSSFDNCAKFSEGIPGLKWKHWASKEDASGYVAKFIGNHPELADRAEEAYIASLALHTLLGYLNSGDLYTLHTANPSALGNLLKTARLNWITIAEACDRSETTGTNSKKKEAEDSDTASPDELLAPFSRELLPPHYLSGAALRRIMHSIENSWQKENTAATPSPSRDEKGGNAAGNTQNGNTPPPAKEDELKEPPFKKRRVTVFSEIRDDTQPDDEEVCIDFHHAGGAGPLKAKGASKPTQIPGPLQNLSSHQLRALAKAAASVAPNNCNEESAYHVLSALTQPEMIGEPAITKVQRIRASNTVKVFSNEGPETFTGVALQSMALDPQYGRDLADAIRAKSSRPGLGGWSWKEIILTKTEDIFTFDPALSLLIIRNLYARQIRYQLSRNPPDNTEALRLEEDFAKLTFKVLRYATLLDPKELHQWLMDIWERTDGANESLHDVFTAELKWKIGRAPYKAKGNPHSAIGCCYRYNFAGACNGKNNKPCCWGHFCIAHPSQEHPFLNCPQFGTPLSSYISSRINSAKKRRAEPNKPRGGDNQQGRGRGRGGDKKRGKKRRDKQRGRGRGN